MANDDAKEKEALARAQAAATQGQVDGDKELHTGRQAKYKGGLIPKKGQEQK